MLSLALLVLSMLFAVLAYDAWRLTVPAKDVPFEVTARPLGMEVDGVQAAELEKRKGWNLRYGLGDPGGAVWLWAIASLGCACGAAWSLWA
jgi:hypothetical protein